MIKSNIKNIPIFDGQIPMMSARSVSQISQLQEELGQYWADHCDYARCGSEVATIRLAYGELEKVYILTPKKNNQKHGCR